MSPSSVPPKLLVLLNYMPADHPLKSRMGQPGTGWDAAAWRGRHAERETTNPECSKHTVNR